MDKVHKTTLPNTIDEKVRNFSQGGMQMEQRPIFENSFISGAIVNDTNYVPVNEDVHEAPGEAQTDAEKDCDFRENCSCCADKTEELCLNPCEEFTSFTVHNVHLHCEGRILKVKVQLKDVSKGRKIRLAVLLYEKECREMELKGLRVCEITVPGFPNGSAGEVTIGDFFFILPEEDICMNHKKVIVEVVAHYSSFPQKYVPDA